MNDWQNFGDADFVGEGGVLLQDNGNGSYDAIVLIVENEDSKFLAVAVLDLEEGETALDLAERINEQGIVNLGCSAYNSTYTADSFESLRTDNKTINECLESMGN